MADPDPHVLAVALGVLSDLPSWHLAAARWDQVDESLRALHAAADTGDATTMRSAVVGLEVMAPVRMARIGATPAVPAPPAVRDRANHLVHRLSRPHSAAAYEPHANGGADGTSPARRP